MIMVRTNKRAQRVASVFLLLGALLSAHSPAIAGTPQPMLDTIELKVGGKVLTTEVAAHSQHRYKGLSFRQSMPNDHAMLFVYQHSQPLLFTMAETLIPLSIAFISDELYHGLVYEKEAASALQFSDNVFVINGFSKYYCMPGLRLGWIIVPKELSRQAEIIAQNLFISAPTLSQYAALEAFDYEYLDGIKKSLNKDEIIYIKN